MTSSEQITYNRVNRETGSAELAKRYVEAERNLALKHELENAEFAAYAEQANRDFEVINNR